MLAILYGICCYGFYIKQHTELNPVQISLLRLFNRPMSETEALEIKNLLVGHYSEILKEEVTKAIKEKGYHTI